MRVVFGIPPWRSYRGVSDPVQAARPIRADTATGRVLWGPFRLPPEVRTSPVSSGCMRIRSPSASMLFAAFTSRWCSAPHAAQRQRRSLRRRPSWRSPQALQLGEGGVLHRAVQPGLGPHVAPGCFPGAPGASPHALGVEVFDRDDLVLVHESMTEPMEVLAPGVGDAGLQACDTGAGARPATGAPALSGETLLEALEACQTCRQLSLAA